MNKQLALEQAVLGLFLKHASVFLSTLYCSLRFRWNEKIPTGCTNGLVLEINPTWFLTLSPAMRVTLLAHELWHVAYMHMTRCGDRDFQIWNMAADYAINIMLEDNGYTFDVDPTTGRKIGLIDDKYRNMSAEQIYDELIAGAVKLELPFGEDISNEGTSGGDGGSDEGNSTAGGADHAPTPITADQQAAIMAAVVRATTMSQMDKQEAGTLPGDFTLMINNLLNPKLAWDRLLRRWLTERGDRGYNWRKRNRRYQDIYLPSRGGQQGLARMLWALDVSGSVDDEQLRIFNSELRGAKELYRPKQMTVVTFDTVIQRSWEFDQGDEIRGLEITGRGGTDMEPVFELARKIRPTAMILFSDMWCNIPPQIPGIPVLWLCYDNPSWNPPYGHVVHVDSTPSIPA